MCNQSDLLDINIDHLLSNIFFYYFSIVVLGAIIYCTYCLRSSVLLHCHHYCVESDLWCHHRHVCRSEIREATERRDSQKHVLCL